MTKAMILAAGEGKRMRPLTLTRPKPLLEVAGRSLIEHQLLRLKQAGIAHCIINVAYLGEQIQQALGDGARYGIHITWSIEPEPLETGGAINHALDHLGDETFLLINGDVWLDYPLSELLRHAETVKDGYLVLVENPDHHPVGDFVLDTSGCVRPVACAAENEKSFTFSGLSLLHPRLVQDYPGRRRAFPLLEAFTHSIGRSGLSGEVYTGMWMDVGTPKRLVELESYLLKAKLP